MLRKLLTVLGIIGAIGLIGWKLKSNKEEMTKNAAIASTKNTVVPVETAVVKKVSLSSDFEGIGYFEPSRQLQFLAEAQGRVTSVHFKEGDQIKEGQLLCRLDDENFQNDMKAARMALDKAMTDRDKVQADLSRMEKLLQSGGINEQTVIDLRAGLASANYGITAAQNRIDALNIVLKKSAVYSPTSGTVVKRIVEKGSFLAPGTPVAMFAVVNPIKLVAKLAEKDVINVKVGQRVRIKADVYPQHDFYGTVKLIGIMADDAKRFPVDIELPNGGGSLMLRGGMTGTAYFKRPSQVDGLMVPRQAIVGSLQNAKVYVLTNDNTVHEKAVTTGTIVNNDVEITEGLGEGDVVVKSGQFNLSEGLKVSPVKAAQ